MDWERLGEKFYSYDEEVKDAVYFVLKSSEREDRQSNVISFFTGVGRALDKLDAEWIKRFASECDDYPPICEGIARGIAGLTSLSHDRVDALLSSRTSAMFVLSKVDLSNPSLKDLVLGAIDRVKDERNLGEVGRNFGQNFHKALKEVREKVGVLLSNPSFAYEFLKVVNFSYFSDIYNFSGEVNEVLGERILELTDFQRRKLLQKSDRWLGAGVGKVFDSLPFELRKVVVEKFSNDREFALGLIRSLDLNSLSDEELQAVVSSCLKDSDLSFFLGNSLGRNFPSLNEDLKSLAEELSSKSVDVARGLGNGFSVLFTRFFDFYFSRDVSEEDEVRVMQIALNNKNVAKEMLRNMNFLAVRRKDLLLKLILEHVEFVDDFLKAVGRRIGEFEVEDVFKLRGHLRVIGRLYCENFPSLSPEKRRKVLEKLNDPEFYQGFVECNRLS
ncbi:MAG: hypothetical protein K1T65_10225 [Candidatus Aramenus sp.]|nr:hypothetical protein [Candidatus Aramenus sp.]